MLKVVGFNVDGDAGYVRIDVVLKDVMVSLVEVYCHVIEIEESVYLVLLDNFIVWIEVETIDFKVSVEVYKEVVCMVVMLDVFVMFVVFEEFVVVDLEDFDVV